jgi:hypothetical protein
MTITKDDWKAAYALLLAEGRKRLGEPPTVKEVEALFEGRLSDEDADRVRELLSYYPEMARVMTQPWPTEEEAAGILTPEELAEDIAKLRQRVNRIRLIRKLKPAFWALAVATIALIIFLLARR